MRNIEVVLVQDKVVDNFQSRKICSEKFADTFILSSETGAIVVDGENIVNEFVLEDSLLQSQFNPEQSVTVCVLDQEGFGSASSVALGWGKKETQFHGSAGKQAAQSYSESAPQLSSEYDDGRIQIIWRDDGLYFAISYPSAVYSGRRRIRVFNEAGELYSTSDPVHSFEPGFCWRRQVQLIATVQRRKYRGVDIVFFETNLERHGDFELLDEALEKRYRVECMEFDPTGYILAVLVCPTTNSMDRISPFVRLITCSSYQWFIKHHLELPTASDPLQARLSFTWAQANTAYSSVGLFKLYTTFAGSSSDFDDNENRLSFPSTTDARGSTLLQCLELLPVYHCFSCRVVPPTPSLPSITNKGTGGMRTENCMGLVAVVNENCLNLTCLAKTVLPPPMYSTGLSFRLSTAATDLRLPIHSVDFPSLWIRPESPALWSDTVPMLVQLPVKEPGSRSVRTLCVLLLITSGASFQPMLFDLPLFDDTRLKVHAQWMSIGGASSASPWVKQAQIINPVMTGSGIASTGNRCNLLMLHVTWLTYSKLAFVDDSGQRLGLLTFAEAMDTSDTNPVIRNASVQWIAKLDSTVEPSTGHPVRICGLCSFCDDYVCLQLSSGLVMVLEVNALVAAEDSTVVSVSPVTLAEVPCKGLRCMIRLPVVCQQLTVAPVSLTSPASASKDLLLALHQPTHRLYAAVIPAGESDPTAQAIVARQVMELSSSFLLTSGFLLATSLRKWLVCASLSAFHSLTDEDCLLELTSRLSIPSSLLNQKPSALMPSASDSKQAATDGSKPSTFYDDHLHPIEPGALLVSALDGGNTKVILQMPRGNLEEVHPRALVLSRLCLLFDNHEYAQATVIMRRHRVNLNLLFDHNPSEFSEHLSLFVQSIDSPDWLTLFITELVDDDVSETIYGKFYAKHPRPSHLLSGGKARQSRSSKINYVCEELLRQLAGDKRFLLPCLTCYAKKVPRELDKALVLLKSYLDAGETVAWQSGVRHLQYFATPPELYRVALGTYDLELAQTMAQLTQLDPKEYMANLKELHALTASGFPCESGDTIDQNAALSYQRFKIDDQLERYSKALSHLYLSGDYRSEELIGYVNRHGLHREALQLYPTDTWQFKSISCGWAQRLLSEQRLTDAGRVHLRAGNLGEAARIFVSANQPRLWSIAVAQWTNQGIAGGPTSTGDLSAAEVTQQAHKLIVRLVELGRQDEAIPLCINFLHAPEKAIIMALEAGMWSEARSLAYLNDRADLVAVQAMRTHIEKAHRVLYDSISDVKSAFQETTQRLFTLRRRHRQDAENIKLAALHGNTDLPDESDFMSDTSSLSDGSLSESLGANSAISRISGRSTRARRKQKAQKWSTKPGSRFEEVGLVHAIAKSIDLGQNLASQVEELTVELWDTGLVSEGRCLLTSANRLLSDQGDAIPLVWDEWLTQKNEVGETSDPNFTGRRQYPFKGETKQSLTQLYLFRPLSYPPTENEQNCRAVLFNWN